MVTLKSWCLANNRKDIINRWSEKNNIMPDEISFGSTKKVIWKCSNGHEWEASPNKITQKLGEGCPYCANQKVWVGFNDLDYLYPLIAHEWNQEKNGALTAKDITAHSNKKVWWTCKYGHEYEMAPNERTAKRPKGCPICANKKLVSGINDLATVCPEAVKEWHPTKNGTLEPSEVFASTRKKIWWVCPNGHEYQATLNNRITGNQLKSGCPICANRIVSFGINDLLSTNPLVAEEWDYKKNSISPKDVVAGSHNKYWWKCPIGHSYKASVENRTKIRATGCPICANELQTSFPEQALYFYIKRMYPSTINRWNELGKEIDIYIPELSIGIEYDGKRYHSSAKRKFEIEKDKFFADRGITIIRIKEYVNGHDDIDGVIWVNEKENQYQNIQYSLNEVIKLLGGKELIVSIEEDGPQILSQYYLSKKSNSLAIKFPKLASEWDFTKNSEIIPEQVSYASAKKFWWKCELGHSFFMSVDSRTTKGTGCPYCAGQKLLIGFNDLATKYPILVREWDEELNQDLKPYDVMPGTKKKVFWKCKNGHSYEAAINSRTNSNSGCPYCSGHRAIVGENDLESLYPIVSFEWDSERNTKKPSEVKPFSHEKVWWKCSKGHSYERSIADKVKSHDKRGNGCPYCSNSRILIGFNDLESRYPHIAKMWDYSKNTCAPSEIMPFSTKKMWWIIQGESKYARVDYIVQKYR